MTIEAYCGDPGMGKTYLMSKLASKKMKKGHRVYANYPLKGAIQYEQLSEILEIRREKDEKLTPCILIDEASLIAPASAWMSIPLTVIAHWRQHRHAGVNIWYTAQDLTDVAKALRNITQFVNYVTKIGPFFVWRTMHPRKKTKYGSGITMFDSELAKSYNSWEEGVKLQDFIKVKK